MNKILLMYIIISFVCVFGIDEYDQNNLETDRENIDHPLIHKKYGIEINPILLLMSEKKQTMATGTFSFFNITRKGEVAILFEYLKKIKDHTFYEDTEEKTISIDAMYRKFLRGTQGGLYFSGGIRYNYRYKPEKINWFDSINVEYKTTTKVGMSFGIGYRYFSDSGLYWGVSLFGGKYFTGIDQSVKKVGDNSPQFMGVELLKFGYAF